jgi:putative oxidoreductase
MKFSMNNAFWARVLIAILFVYAGIGKLMGFSGFVAMALVPKFGALASLVGVLVILIEIVVALAFVFGYKAKWSAWTLMAFTALATILYHNPWASGAFDNNMLVMALKNISIIGGIWLACEMDSHHRAHHA